MSAIEFNITKTVFAEYKYSVGDWLERDWSGGQVYGQVRNRTKKSMTVDGNTISGDEGEPVYKMEEYDTDDEEFTGQMIAAPQSGLRKWSNPPSDMSSIEAAALSMSFSEHGGGELDEVYSNWSDAVNMTASQLERWADHPCADTASRDPSAVRERNMRLLETNKSDWDSTDIKDAKRTVSFISRMRGQRPESPAEGGKGSCPSKWAVSLLNWAYNPFDGIPDGTPDPDTENSSDGAGLVYDDNDDPIQIGFSASPVKDSFIDGFNEFGVRRNFSDDGETITSVDAIYEAMAPGAPENRNGFRITEEFLRTLANKDYSNNPPYMMDHSEDTLSQIGFVKDVWFDETKGKLMLLARAYNTGSTIHNEIVNRLTHEPPATPDGSVGLNESYKAIRNDDDEVEIVDARIEEFSTTPFPGGYDEGGLRASGSVR